MEREEADVPNDNSEDGRVATPQSSIALLRMEARRAGRSFSIPEDDLLPPLIYQQGGLWQPMPLHQNYGRDIRIISEQGVVMTTDTIDRHDIVHGRVSTARPLLPGENLVVQVLSQVAKVNFVFMYERMSERPELHLVEDSSGPRRLDEFGFYMTPSGEINISKNGQLNIVIEIDPTWRFWFLLNIFESAQKVRIMSCLPIAEFGSRSIGHADWNSLETGITLCVDFT